MSCSIVTGEISIVHSFVQWKITDLPSISNYRYFKSPSFVFENRSSHIVLKDVRGSCYPHFQLVCAFDTVMNVPPSSDWRERFLSKAEIKIGTGTRYTFRSNRGKRFHFTCSEICNFWNNDIITIYVELMSESFMSKAAKRALSECDSYECDAKRYRMLSQNLKEAYLNKQGCDMTINVRQRVFEVHKLIMIVRSPVFAAMMRHDMVESKNNTVDVPDCDPDAFEVFLLFLYSGEIEKLSKENVLDVYFVADKYGVDELKTECVGYIKNNFCVDRFCDFIELAFDHNELDLLEVAKKYFVKNALPICQTVTWQPLMKKNTELVNGLILLSLRAQRN